MNKYKVLEEWKRGAFGETCFVEERGGKGKYAIKKVECTDERGADLALKESLVLLDLHHPNICPYKEFFMFWDNKVSSLSLCLVMEYSGRGHLEQMVKANRDEKNKIDEKIIKTLLGQAVDALIYIHKKKVLHRNVKPSNILIKDEETFLISDFLSETLMTDEMRMKIRVYPESKLFAAPESARLSFSEKSDVWSLGCVLLEMMTCSSHSKAEAAALLQGIKNDQLCLEEALKTLQGSVGYSDGLCQVLERMLRIHPEERAAATDLIKDRYVNECLVLTASPLSGLKKTLAARSADELDDGGMEKVLAFMRMYSEYEDAQTAALRRLSKLSADRDGFSPKGDIMQHIVEAMKLHNDSVEIHLEGCRILKDLLSQDHGFDDVPLASNSLITCLVAAARKFSESGDLVSLLLEVLMMLSTNEAAAELLGKSGFLQDTVKILERSHERRDVSLSCCGLLWCLAMAESCSQVEWLEYSVPVIYTLIRKHLHDGQLVESACCCLWILCLKGCVLENQIESIIFVLLDSLRTHPDRPVLVKNVCLAVAGLLRISELAAYRIVVPVSGKSSLSLITAAYLTHSDDPEIVENICLLYREMARYESVRAELQLQDTERLMCEIKEKFASTEEIVNLAESTLSRLGNKGNLPTAPVST
ncbi:serine/threonine kinase-like domain-containing protein STKLD1 [Spea bombifrons]|uniref:serine/threonine kinase-like domain-containing protein STKLD1 n=1 Tax=Spea bombifrons TaxID=233779 RepID=UPI002348FD36|nr:serine/threonine kinase-like domain-containing protein STKLD1 [Spea bombifrons]